MADKLEEKLGTIVDKLGGTIPEPSEDRLGDYLDTIIENMGGGSGGTSNYNDLSNKPTIDGVELRKGATHSELGILGTADKADLQNAINNKQEKLTAGSGISIEDNVISATGSIDYPGEGGAQAVLTKYTYIAGKLPEQGEKLHRFFVDCDKLISYVESFMWDKASWFGLTVEVENSDSYNIELTNVSDMIPGCAIFKVSKEYALLINPTYDTQSINLGEGEIIFDPRSVYEMIVGADQDPTQAEINKIEEQYKELTIAEDDSVTITDIEYWQDPELSFIISVNEPMAEQDETIWTPKIELGNYRYFDEYETFMRDDNVERLGNHFAIYPEGLSISENISDNDNSVTLESDVGTHGIGATMSVTTEGMSMDIFAGEEVDYTSGTIFQGSTVNLNVGGDVFTNEVMMDPLDSSITIRKGFDLTTEEMILTEPKELVISTDGITLNGENICGGDIHADIYESVKNKPQRLFTFTVNEQIYFALAHMTWEEFIESDLNSDGDFWLEDNWIVHYKDYNYFRIVTWDVNYQENVLGQTEIQENGTYHAWSGR